MEQEGRVYYCGTGREGVLLRNGKGGCTIEEREGSFIFEEVRHYLVDQ